jgi:DNA repair photolyase
MQIREIKATKALSLTGINLAQRVINPYRGCYYACSYCYASRLKAALKAKEQWGQYIDVKINIDEVLKTELEGSEEFETVLIGSVTEVYQPVEETYRLMDKILKLLKKHNKKIVILTRSPLILMDIELLKKISSTIYFTFTPEEVYKTLEARSPDLEARLKAIKTLKGKGVNVIPYVCPMFPESFDFEKYIELFKSVGIDEIHFENVNMRVLGTTNSIQKLGEDLLNKLTHHYSKREVYESYWSNIKNEITKSCQALGVKSRLFIHEFDEFCKLDYKT